MLFVIPAHELIKASIYEKPRGMATEDNTRCYAKDTSAMKELLQLMCALCHTSYAELMLENLARI